MPKTKISEYSATANSNTDVASINIDEGCAPSGINNAIRAIMGHLKDFQSGTSNDPFTIGSSGSLTLSYGTANGVAYLNGSKVLTTGSALKFDGTALAIGSVTPSTWMLDVKSAGTGVVTNGIRFNRSNVTTQYGVLNYEGGQFNNVVVNTAGTGCFWGVLYSSDGSTTTQPLALDASGNLGVGTTSPDTKLNTEGGSLRVSGTRTAGSFLDVAPSNTGTDGVALSVSYYGSGNYGPLKFSTGGSERARITSGGDLLVGKTSASNTVTGSVFNEPSTSTHYLSIVNTTADNSGARLLYLNRQGSDGDLIQFNQANTQEGSISVSGTTVSYNGGHLSRWAQTTAPKDNTLVKGTVLSNLDEMNVYTDEEGNPVDNEQLNKVKVSDVEGDVNVAGVFVNWSHDEAHDVDEINMAMTGDMIIRIAQGVTIARGDLLMSAGDGTAKPQGDDIVRSKTVAKVTSIHVACTYEDGSYCVPCVLMAC